MVVTSWPSTFVDAYPWRFSTRPFASLRRAPGASRLRSIQLRPLSGSSDIWRGSMFAPTPEVAVLTSGASPVTVTVSCSVDGAIWKFTMLVCPTSIWVV
jgi:hypothetical protein